MKYNYIINTLFEGIMGEARSHELNPKKLEKLRHLPEDIGDFMPFFRGQIYNNQLEIYKELFKQYKLMVKDLKQNELLANSPVFQDIIEALEGIRNILYSGLSMSTRRIALLIPFFEKLKPLFESLISVINIDNGLKEKFKAQLNNYHANIIPLINACDRNIKIINLLNQVYSENDIQQLAQNLLNLEPLFKEFVMREDKSYVESKEKSKEESKEESKEDRPLLNLIKMLEKRQLPQFAVLDSIINFIKKVRDGNSDGLPYYDSFSFYNHYQTFTCRDEEPVVDSFLPQKKLHYIWVGGKLPRNYFDNIINLNAPEYEKHIWTDNPDVLRKAISQSPLCDKISLQMVSVDSKIEEPGHKKPVIYIHSLKEVVKLIKENCTPFAAKYLIKILTTEGLGIFANYAAKSDFIRLIVLYFKGGIYLDTDIQYSFKSVDALFAANKIIVNHLRKNNNNAEIAGIIDRFEQQSEYFNRIINLLFDLQLEVSRYNELNDNKIEGINKIIKSLVNSLVTIMKGNALQLFKDIRKYASSSDGINADLLAHYENEVIKLLKKYTSQSSEANPEANILACFSQLKMIIDPAIESKESTPVELQTNIQEKRVNRRDLSSFLLIIDQQLKQLPKIQVDSLQGLQEIKQDASIKNPIDLLAEVERASELPNLFLPYGFMQSLNNNCVIAATKGHPVLHHALNVAINNYKKLERENRIDDKRSLFRGWRRDLTIASSGPQIIAEARNHYQESHPNIDSSEEKFSFADKSGMDVFSRQQIQSPTERIFGLTGLVRIICDNTWLPKTKKKLFSMDSEEIHTPQMRIFRNRKAF